MSRRSRPSSAGFQSRLRLRAFTLLEILIVMSLLVLLSAMAWPALQSQLLSAELPDSAARFQDTLYMARAEAAKEYRRYRIRFAPDEQEPHIEYEPDPILYPGQWEPVESAWAQEPILLGEVQLHEIRPGRPIFLRPISITETPEEVEERTREEEDELAEFDALAARSPADDAEIDEIRPPIVFEADGSTDWATIILAKVPLEEAVEETHDQLWIILDGRTGLARLREKVTKDQLSDEAFYVQREKLEFPDEVDAGDLSFDVGSSSDGDSGRGGFEIAAPAASGSDAGGGQNVRSPEDASSDESGGRRGSRRGEGGDPSRGDPDDQDAVSDLERKLEDSDLTEEERENIRRTLGGGRRGR